MADQSISNKRMTDERMSFLGKLLPDMKITEKLVMELFESLKAEREQLDAANVESIEAGEIIGELKGRIEQLEEDFRHMTDFRDHWKCKSQILEAERKEIEECQRYTILAAILADGEPGITVTTDNPDGEWIEAKDLQAILNKGEG